VKINWYSNCQSLFPEMDLDMKTFLTELTNKADLIFQISTALRGRSQKFQIIVLSLFTADVLACITFFILKLTSKQWNTTN